jgi:NAD(P)-dependent dehydrogenase (short-subunit alcohol dehydrogenase family)
MLAEALQSKRIAVYAMCPGWVKTDMGGASAPRSPEQGADTAIWLATEAAPSLSGKFFRDRQEISY